MEMILSGLILFVSIFDIILLSESKRLQYNNKVLLLLSVITAVVLSVLWGIGTIVLYIEKEWIGIFMTAMYYAQSIIRFYCYLEAVIESAIKKMNKMGYLRGKES